MVVSVCIFRKTTSVNSSVFSLVCSISKIHSIMFVFVVCNVQQFFFYLYIFDRAIQFFFFLGGGWGRGAKMHMTKQIHW